MKFNLRLTVFQKLFLSFMLIGLIAVFFSAVSHYHLLLSSVEKDLRAQVLSSFSRAAEYFEEFYDQAIRDDLELIASTPLLDNYLMSQNNEIYLTQPNVEKLLLHFTKASKTKYLSAQFINAKGEATVVTEGNRRRRQFSSTSRWISETLNERIFGLVKRMEAVPAGTILFDGPFEFDKKWTFLAGVSKQDPEGGGYAGAVIMHTDLTPYIKYLSQIKFRGIPVISLSRQDQKILLNSQDFVSQLFSGRADHASEMWHTTEQSVKLGDGGEFLKIKMRIPKVLFVKELQFALMNTLWVGLFIMIVVGASAFVVSHNIIKPIKQLVESTKRVSSGDLSSYVQNVSEDEIGQLGKSFNEMVDSLKKFEERLQYEAFHDVLTALPNRALLLDRLERMIERNRRHPEHHFAVLFVDLDRFKNVNDSMGHTKGDELLVAISHRLRLCLRTMDTVARLGGDEFIILMDEIYDVNDASALADRILKELAPAFTIDGQEIYVTASIGIAISNPACTQPSDYLRDTDIAMYRAKSLGKARYHIFDTSMHTSAMASMQMESDLRSAVERDEFTIYYQPVVSLRTRKVERLEALIRWRHPRKGLVAPSEFIPLAEETGLIFPIGHWVMETVCKQIKAWMAQSGDVLPIAFNFSAKQFEQKDLIPTLKNLLAQTGIRGDKLIIEITESTAMADVSLSISVLNELRALGIKIAIDDFGIGYSSLSSLKLFPIDELKIDRSFIKDIIENPDKAAIAKAIIVMAHSLGYTVTGEGIETKEQLEFLVKNGCDSGQGLLFAAAAPLEQIQDILKA